MYDSFIGKKHSVEERLSGLNASVAKHERMNRALRVGRMPTIAVAILSRLANAGLDEYFRVVGTRGRHHPQNCEGGDPHPIRLSNAEDDLRVVQAKRADELVNAPEFSEIVVAESGKMARLTTIHPAVFVSFKRWMSKEADRDPLKRRRDALQADAVEWALHERLPHLLADR